MRRDPRWPARGRPLLLERLPTACLPKAEPSVTDHDDRLEDLKVAYRATWSLFQAIEAGDDDMISLIWDEYDELELLRGWHVVAKSLREALLEHAEQLGCGCGSEEWLGAESLRIAGDS